jgi:hypothetical protein
VWTIKGLVPQSSKEKLKHRVKDEQDEYWYISRSGFADFSELPDAVQIVAPGVIKFSGMGISGAA